MRTPLRSFIWERSPGGRAPNSGRSNLYRHSKGSAPGRQAGPPGYTSNVPIVNCPCGLNFETTGSAAGCPKCGTLPAVPLPAVAEDKIRFFCGCGAKLTATARFVGKTIDCPGCGQAAPVPALG